MKVTTQTQESQSLLDETGTITLQRGLVGFPTMREVEIVYSDEELPFMWLQEKKSDGLRFIVAEASCLVKDYIIELMDSDAIELELEDSNDALIVNIITIIEEPVRKVLANLVGPVVVNQKTRKGKQLVIANYNDYSARHLIYQEE